MPERRPTLNLSNFFQRRWVNTTSKTDLKVGPSGFTAGERRTRFLSGLPITKKDDKQKNLAKRKSPQKKSLKDRQQLANRGQRRPLTPNDAIAFVRAHTFVLADAKCSGELKRLSELGHDVIAVTINAEIARIPEKERPGRVMAKGKPLQMKNVIGGWSRTSELLLQISGKADTPSAIRRAARQMSRTLSIGNIKEEQELNALKAIADATDAQIVGALGQRNKVLKAAEAREPMNVSGPVRTLIRKILERIPINTTLEFRAHLIKTLNHREDILAYGRMNKEQLERELVNHGVLPPARRR